MTRARRLRSPLEQLHAAHTNAVNELLFQIKAARLPEPLTEFCFHESRRWRFDIAWTRLERPWWRVEDDDIYAAVEVDGGTFLPKGRHTTGVGFKRDCEKLNTATVLGWRVLRVTPKHIRNGQALTWIQELLT